jgi:hypothetical protein
MQKSIGAVAGLMGVMVALAGANVALALWFTNSERSEAALGQVRSSAPNLRLLSEVDRAEQATRCEAFGPFSASAEFDALRADLEDLGARIQVQEHDVEGPPDHLVYIGPESSLDAVRRVHRELTSLGIDNHIIAQGSLANTVAIGVFAGEDRALARQAQVRELGYEVELRTLARSHPVFHLLARVGADVALPADPVGSCADIARPDLFL